MTQQGDAWAAPRGELHVIDDSTDSGEEDFQGDAFAGWNFNSSSSPPRRHRSPSDQGSQELETEEVVQRRFNDYHARRSEFVRKNPEAEPGGLEAVHVRRAEQMLRDYSEMSARSASDDAKITGNVTSDSRGVKRRRVSLNGPAQTANEHVYQARAAVRRIVFAEREAVAARREQASFIEAAKSNIEMRKRELKRLRHEVARADQDTRRVRLERDLDLTEAETDLIVIMCFARIWRLYSVTAVAEAKVKLCDEDFRSCSPLGETKVEGVASSRPKPQPSDIRLPPPPHDELLGITYPTPIRVYQARNHIIYSQMRQITSNAAQLNVREGQGAKRKTCCMSKTTAVRTSKSRAAPSMTATYS